MINNQQKTNLEVLTQILLMAGMFFNPLGFDIIFKMMLDATNSYWITTGIFYGISLSFFGLYFLFYRYLLQYNIHFDLYFDSLLKNISKQSIFL